MNTQAYKIECDETGYCIVGQKGVVASFGLIEDAFNAMYDFNHKTFPTNWQKIPPAILHAKQMYYGG